MALNLSKLLGRGLARRWGRSCVCTMGVCNRHIRTHAHVVRTSEITLQNRSRVWSSQPNDRIVRDTEIMTHLSRAAAAAARIEIRSTWRQGVGLAPQPPEYRTPPISQSNTELISI